VQVLAGLPPDGVIFGRSAAMRSVRDRIERICLATIPVLIQGESGTGKEIFAKLIHDRSPWRERPFVKVLCPAIAPSVFENVLLDFGTRLLGGTTNPNPGRTEAAQGGTLFLDEIADLDTQLQAKLLRLLQEGRVLGIGASGVPQAMSGGMRVLCATRRSVKREMESGKFRPDLFYRLNAMSIHLPPLRDRREDIPVLAEYFLQYYALRYDRPARPLPAQFLHRLQEYDWPGNIRELENLINSFLVLGCETALIEWIDRLPGDPMVANSAGGFVPLRKIAQQAAREAERRIILQVLEASEGNRKRAARALNLSYRALLYKIRGAGIPPKRVPVPCRGATLSPADCQSS
jgi:two-component system, NtrC family, response regulator AtoC